MLISKRSSWGKIQLEYRIDPNSNSFWNVTKCWKNWKNRNLLILNHSYYKKIKNKVPTGCWCVRYFCWSLDSVNSHSSCSWLPLHSASRSIHLHHHSRAARVLTANISPSHTSPSQPYTARLTLCSAPPITAIHLRSPCPPIPADHALRRPNRNQLSSTTSPNSKPSSRPTVTSPSADSVLSSPVGNPHRRRFGFRYGWFTC